LYLKSSHVYVELFLKHNKKFLVRKSLNDILASLSANFIRVQRSFVVNIKHITEVKNSSINILQNEIPIGKTFKEELLKRINLV